MHGDYCGPNSQKVKTNLEYYPFWPNHLRGFTLKPVFPVVIVDVMIS
jgi:hypothetical protein